MMLPLFPRIFTFSLLSCLLVGVALPAAAKFDSAKDFVESPGVAAHFSVPEKVVFDTPAFKKGKMDFTSQQEMEKFIARIAKISPYLRVASAGRSQEGRDIPLLIFSTERLASADTLVKNGKPTVLIVALQHGNEPAAGEAALMYARSLAQGKEGDILSDVNVIIMPRANPDGAERFTRDLANGVNLNRDHLLLNSPEGEAINKVMTQYQPDVVLDAHEFSVAERWVKKFSAVQQYDALVQYATTTNLPAQLSAMMASPYNEALFNAFRANGLNGSVYYTTDKVNLKDKTLSMGGIGADALRNVAGLRNAIAFLLETRGVGIGKAHFERRVWTQVVAMRAMIDTAAQQGSKLSAFARQVDVDVARTAGQGELVVKGKAMRGEHEVTMLDVHSGDPKTFTVDWRSSLTITPVLTRARPYGYLLPLGQRAAAEKLRKLGVEVYTVQTGQNVPVERYDIVSRKEGQKFDVTGKVGAIGNEMVDVSTALTKIRLGDVQGFWYVPLNQPLANLVIAALEPETQGSFVANGVVRLPPVSTSSDSLPLYRVMENASLVLTLF